MAPAVYWLYRLILSEKRSVKTMVNHGNTSWMPWFLDFITKYKNNPIINE